MWISACLASNWKSRKIENCEDRIVERENSRPITSWHVTLLSPQNIANYKAPCTTVGFVITIQKPIEICQVSCKNQSRISARVSDDSSSLARVSNDSSNLACVSDDLSGPTRLWHVSPIKLRHVSLTHPQTPINKSLLETFRRTRIQKGESSVKIKPQSLQELQPQNRRTFEAKSSKSFA